ncbi:acetate kinase [Bacteroidia bacterium]|nr:acetate kinase [Bacteroidia bacterium]
MKILVLNCGSSSIKYKLFDIDNKTTLGQGGVEKVGMTDSFLKHETPSGEKVVLQKEILEHGAGIAFILETLTSKEYGGISSLQEINAIGHRVVHGGEKFNKSVLITDEVVKNIEACIDIAPLHNPPNLAGIRAMAKLIPDVPQVAVFDTAFHQTMPPHAYLYGIPYTLYKKYGIRRYGFHGTSHRYVSRRACEILNVNYEEQKIISLHIGNGASATAIAGGKVIDTSLGFTPIEGLLMGTRCGDLDIGAATYLMDKENLDTKAASDLFNKQSGLLGLSEVSSDMRDLEKATSEGNSQAQTALEVFAYRIKKYIGAYAAALGGLDVLIFTGGIGENSWGARSAACKDMEFFDIEIDETKNDGLRGKETVISPENRRVKVIVVPTDEEFMIAQDTLALIK